MKLGDKLGLFYGHDNNALGAFAFGATGWVSGSGNFDPKRWSKIVHLCIDEGNFVAGSPAVGRNHAVRGPRDGGPARRCGPIGSR